MALRHSPSAWLDDCSTFHLKLGTFALTVRFISFFFVYTRAELGSHSVHTKLLGAAGCSVLSPLAVHDSQTAS